MKRLLFVFDFNWTLIDKNWIFHQETADLLNKYKKYAVNSNTELIYGVVSGCKEVKTWLENHSQDHHFKFIVGGCKLGKGDKAKAILKMMDDCLVTKYEVVFFDDMIEFIDEVKELTNVFTIHVDNNTQLTDINMAEAINLLASKSS